MICLEGKANQQDSRPGTESNQVPSRHSTELRQEQDSAPEVILEKGATFPAQGTTQHNTFPSLTFLFVFAFLSLPISLYISVIFSTAFTFLSLAFPPPSYFLSHAG
jgi:hypothetical protein